MEIKIPDTFGSFRGVFIPTFLSILAVIVYLRLAFVIGSVGVLGTIIIIVLGVSVTLATALALSSITSNIRIGSGGVYSIISKTLGLEVGGSVGIPLFLAQTFAVVLGIFGFTEGWSYLFPLHPSLGVAMFVFLALFFLAFLKTYWAVRAQLIMFIISIASFTSIFMGLNWLPDNLPAVMIENFNLNFDSSNFWIMFGILFPGLTGLMAGIGLSGELSDPKKQIPRGMLWAIGVTTIIYITLVVLLGQTVGPEQLISDNKILIKVAAHQNLVLIGLLIATFSAALSNLLSASRILQALGANSILPMNAFFADKTASGVPRNAVFFLSLLILPSLYISSLNTIARMLTVFYLMTYAMINLVVFTEQTLGLVSFRPTLRIPKIIPLYGAIASMVFMFLISAVAGMIAIAFFISVYVFLITRKLKPKEGDVRSGLFVTIAEWAAEKVRLLPESSKHIWKPNTLLPVITTKTLLGSFPLIKAISYPHGTMSVLGLELTKKVRTPEKTKVTVKEMKEELEEVSKIAIKFRREGIYASFSLVSVKDYTQGICTSLEAIEGQVFHPNILFLPFKPNMISSSSLSKIFKTSRDGNVGVILFDKDEDIGLGSEQDIHVWISPKIMDQEFYVDRKFDLSMLIAYRIHTNWQGNLNLWMCVKKDKQSQAERYLKKLVYEARFPVSTIINISNKSFRRQLRIAPQGDIHIIPVDVNLDIKIIRSISKAEKKSFLFISDSEKEDILA